MDHLNQLPEELAKIQQVSNEHDEQLNPQNKEQQSIEPSNLQTPQNANNNNTSDITNSGASLPKCPTSHCVINIVPPRDQWDAVQRIRTLNQMDCRCGPHITFIDPFVELEFFPHAASLLEDALKDFPPFQIKFEKFNYFVHKKSATLYLEPETEDPTALQNLMQAVMKVFPQCDESIQRGRGNGYVPHLSVAKFSNERELLKTLNKLKESWKPISFLCNEFYVLNRIQGDPFQVKHVVKFGGDTAPSHFGPTSGQDNSPLRRTLLIAGFPKNKIQSDLDLLDFIEKAGYKPFKCEILINPGGKPRTCGLVEFSTEEEMLNCISTYSYQPFETMVYVKPLPTMMFPDVIGSTTSYFVAQALAN